MSFRKSLLILLAILLCAARTVPAAMTAGDLTVLDAPADTMMRSYLTTLVARQFARRDSLLATLITAQQWDTRAEHVRRQMHRMTGPMPGRTPLNAVVTGVLERDGYRVEKLYFQSRPGFFVSANLYLPAAGKGPFPAILYNVGHSITGKAAVYVQPFCIAMARKGFAVMAIDAAGQGERRQQAYTVFGNSPGAVHQTVGFQAFLAGTHMFNLMVWDAVRAVDYLTGRPEVDKGRIGVTGTSGGGMMSTYILAFDNRIAAAVPACNPNTWLARVNANLATDHEQVFFGAFAGLVDPRGDPLLCLAPRPLLIDATSRDNLNPPEGVWALDSWLYRAWAAHGAPEKMHTSMVDAPHDYNQAQREAAYAWFGRWLKDNSGADFAEGEIRLEPDSLLWATPAGSVFDLPGSRDPWSLVREYYEGHKATWSERPGSPEFTAHVRKVLMGIAGIDKIPEPRAIQRLPATRKDGVTITPLIFEPEIGIALPSVFISPAGVAPEMVLVYLDSDGKQSLASSAIAPETLGSQRLAVLAVDLRGQGETSPGLEGKFWDFLAGNPIPAMRIRDILCVISWLQNEYPEWKIMVHARGTDGLWAAMAAALDEGVLSLVVDGAPVDFADMVQTRLTRFNEELILPAVLTKLDMQQVYQAICPRKVSMINPLRADRERATADFVKSRFETVAETYRKAGSGSNWLLKVD